MMLFQSSASMAKSDIDRYYGTCMGHNFMCLHFEPLVISSMTLWHL